MFFFLFFSLSYLVSIIPISKFKSSSDYLLGELTQLTTDETWQVTKSTGEENQLTFWSLNAKDKKTELGWIPPDNDCSGWSDKYLYDNLGNRIKDDKSKDILLKCESSKCGGMNCYHISLTNASAVNIDEFIQLGEGTIVTEYQEDNLLNYHETWFDLNISLVCEDFGNEIWVYDNQDKKKFGANITNIEQNVSCKYIVNSTSEILQDSNYVYYLEKKTTSKCGAVSCENSEIHEINFQDICQDKSNETDNWFEPNCSFSNIIQTDLGYELSVDFYAWFNSTSNLTLIDPLISVGNSSSYESYNMNVTGEGYPMSHITMGNGSFEDDVVLYMPMDLENTSSGKVFDFSEQNNDGTLNGNLVFTSSGMYGGAYEFDGTLGYIDCGDIDSYEFPEITVSAWAKLDYLNLASSPGLWIVNKGTKSWILYWATNERITFLVENSTGSEVQASVNSVADNDWHHYVGVYNGTYVLIYQDGVLQNDQEALTGNIRDDTANLFISDDAAGNAWNGTIDEVTIWNRSLSNAEITALYNNQTYRFRSPPSNQFFQIQNIQQNGSLNRINLTTNSTQNFGTNLQGRIGEITIDSYDSSVLPYEPEFWYRFDNYSSVNPCIENITDLRDWGKRGMNLTCDLGANDCPDTVSQSNLPIFKGKLFDGSDEDYVGIDSDILNNMTILAWVNYSDPDDLNQVNMIVVKATSGSDTNGEWEFGVQDVSGGRLHFDCGGSTVTSGSTTLEGKWAFVGMTFDVNTTIVNYYINGKYFDTDTNTDTCLVDDTDPMVIGGSTATSSTENFEGEISEIMVFDEILTADEIWEIYIKGGFNPTYSVWETITNGNNAQIEFNITTSTNYTLLEINYSTDAYNFYSPILRDWIGLESYYQVTGPAADDTTFTVTLPTGVTLANFVADSSGTEANVTPTGQNITTPFLNISNAGNVDLNISIYLNETTAAEVRLNANPNNDSSQSTLISTTPILINTTLPQGMSIGVWFWSDFLNSPITNFSRQLNVSVVKS